MKEPLELSVSWQTEGSALIVVTEILVASFVAWPIIACIYYNRKSGESRTQT